MDTLEENQAKAARIKNGFATLKAKVEEVKPDVLVVVGDDQLECFDFNNFPSFGFYVGEEFEGQTSQRDSGFGRGPGGTGAPGTQAPAGATAVAERPAVPKARLKGHPELGTQLMLGVMKRGFDPAFSMDMPKPEHGIGHAILRPAESLTDMQTPIVPILVNC